MEKSIRESTDKNGNKVVTYRKEWEKNGIRFSKEVRQVEGGFIIRESKYGKPKDDPEADYIDESREFVSTENPFKGNEEEEKMFSFIDKPEF